jgi:Raf kinase inhibitor-like YbhB/YbcL family protein
MMSFKLESSSFEDGAVIPADYAFAAHDAETHVRLAGNKNPHLKWSGEPEGTKSFALIIVDDKVPSSGEDVNQEGKSVPFDLPRVDFFHWLVANISSSTHEIPEGTASNGVTAKGKAAGQSSLGWEGKNDYTAWFAGDADMEGVYGSYDGPCPPWNDTMVHEYQFEVYALDVESLELPEAYDGAALRSAMEGHILGKASLLGLYTINPDAVRA